MAYIVEKYAGQGIKADENVVRELVELTGGHPYDTMLLCNEAYHLLLQTGGRDLTLTLLRQAYAQALRILEPALTEILDELGRSAHMREVICRLAADSRPYRGGTHPSSVARTRYLFRSS